MTNRVVLLSVIFLATVPGRLLSQTVAESPPLRSAGDRPVDIRHLKLELDVDLEARRIAGTATLDLVVLRPLSTIRLDAVNHQLTAVRGRRGKDKPSGLEFENTGREILIHLPARAAAAESSASASRCARPSQAAASFHSASSFIAIPAWPAPSDTVGELRTAVPGSPAARFLLLGSPRARLRMHLRPYSSCAENFIREPVSVESPKLENLKARNYYKIVAVSMLSLIHI